MTSIMKCAALTLMVSEAVMGEELASLAAPSYIGPARPEHAVTNRAFQGIPSLAVAPRGRLWANWYAGVTSAEDHNNYVVLSTSGDDGETWNEVLIVDPDGGGMVRSFDPELWVSPDDRLIVFWAQMQKGRRDARLGVWYIETSHPDKANPQWSAPRRIADGVMMCKPLVLSTGEWALPISKWREHDHSAQMMVSTDQGKTWLLRGGCNVPVNVRAYDEHMFVERRNGSIWLLARTQYGIGESVSSDRGKTWPELRPSSILHTPARFFIRRLASGNLLLIKHGPITAKTGRSHLTAFISMDDGRTWSGGLLLDERRGVSYPDGQQTEDGLIRIIYDFSRTGDRKILMAMFREEDAFAGKAVSDDIHLRKLVSTASGPADENSKLEARHREREEAVRRSGFERALSQEMPDAVKALPIFGTIEWIGKRMPLIEPGPHAGVSGAGIVAANGRIYVMGGFIPAGDETEHPSRRTSRWVHQYDPAFDRWTKLPDLPARREYTRAIPAGDEVYVLGGGVQKPMEGVRYAANADVFRLDTAVKTPRWQTVAPLTVPRTHMAVGKVGNFLVVAGGNRYDSADGGYSSRTIQNVTDVLDLTNPRQQWSQRAPIPGSPRGWCASASLNEKLYLFGGLAFAPTPERSPGPKG